VPPHPPYGGFWIRFLGHVLDSILYGLVTLPFAVASFVLFRVAFEDCFTIGDDDTIHCPNGALKGGPLALGIILLVAGAVVALLLYIRHLGRTGQTWGRKIVGIKVVDRDRLVPIGMGRALGRTFFSVISAYALYLGYLWMLWDKQKQTWQDKIVSSIVVKA
jgi:uncharacterized RDD family membrane protein YckC